jgi:hypothetical protein
MVKVTLWTVVEAPGYLKKAARIFSQEEMDQIVTMLATDHECGAVVVGTGGVRKVRIARGSRGKSAGARVVYYFHGDEGLPIYVLAVFTKTEKDNLSPEEKNALARFVEETKRALKAKEGKRP